MQQFLLSFFVNTATVVLHADYCHAILRFQLHQHLRVFITELNSIAYQIAYYGLQHIDVGGYS